MALAPVIPVLTVASVEDGLAQAKALVAGGLYAIEVTLRTPSALAAIQAIAKNVPDAVVGAGTIVSVEQIDQAVAAGARFLVSPGAPAALAKAAAQVAGSVPAGLCDGLGSDGLRELGFRALKLFPAEAVGGAKLLASLAAPLPDLRFCPTGGIDLQKAPEYLSCQTCPASAARGCCRRRRSRRGTISRSKLCRATRRSSSGPPLVRHRASANDGRSRRL